MSSHSYLVRFLLSFYPYSLRLATLWMNEEWFNDNAGNGLNRVRNQYATSYSTFIPLININPIQSSYERWLLELLNGYRPSISSNDKTFTSFLMDLPAIPDSVYSLLREFCENTETYVLLRAAQSIFSLLIHSHTH
jgi:symplekin